MFRQSLKSLGYLSRVSAARAVKLPATNTITRTSLLSNFKRHNSTNASTKPNNSAQIKTDTPQLMIAFTYYQGYSNNYNNGYNGGDYNSGGFETTGEVNNGSQQGKTYSKSSLTPVTIKQIIESKQLVQDGDFVINNLELNLVSFVGVIRGVIDGATNLKIQVEDGSGTIEINKWLDDKGSEDSTVEFLVQGKYVAITGSVKEFNGKKSIQHATFKEIKDFNQVLYHHLNAINIHLKAQGLLNKDEKLFISKPSDGENSSSSGSGGNVLEKIYQFIAVNTPSMSEGVPVQLIAQSLNLLTDDVVLHCGKLAEDARIYSGYDENGFLAVL